MSSASWRERGISGYELIRAMGMTRAGDLLGLVEYPAVEERTFAEEMERLNRIARPWAIFAEPVPEGHLVGAVDVLDDTEVPGQKATVRVISTGTQGQWARMPTTRTMNPMKQTGPWSRRRSRLLSQGEAMRVPIGLTQRPWNRFWKAQSFRP